MNRIIKYSDSTNLENEIHESLALAREKFGNYNQILVSVEELCELSSIISKLPRYSDIEDARNDLKNKVLDEVADVLIVMDHVMSILDLSDDEIKERIHKKMVRMIRWLNESDSQEITITDRSV